MPSTPSVNIARLTYLLVCEAAGVAIALSTGIHVSIGIAGGLLVAGFFIWVETLIQGFTLRGFSTATFGLGVGLLCAWLLTRVQISSLLALAVPENPDFPEIRELYVDSMRLAIDATLYSGLGFLGAVLALRSNQEEFAFIIPYVRFRQDASVEQPVVIDAEAIIDGRLSGVVRSGFLAGRLVVPRFVLEDLQSMAASPQNGTRLRGQRGLDTLESMQSAADIHISIHDSIARTDGNTGNRLIETARLLGARLMTGDENLTKVAKLQGLKVLNIDDLESSLKPPAAIGDTVRIALVRNGKEDHQAVGYLPDGTMIVVNHGAPKIGTTVNVTVVSTLQTSAGLMVFSELSE